METVKFEVENKRFAPYFKEFYGLDLSQMREIIAFLSYLMREKEKQTECQISADVLKSFKTSSEITDEDRRYVAEKIQNMKFSSYANALTDGLSIGADELKDERTRYILGIK